jgi:hypothetical protein
MSSAFLEVDGNQFRDGEYGVFVNDSSRDAELFGALKAIGQAAMQNDKISMSGMIDIYASESITQIRRKVEASEEAAQMAAQQAAAAQKEEVDKNIQLKLLVEQAKNDLERYKIDTDAQTKIQVAQIGSFARQQDQDLDKDLIPDQLEVGKLALEQQRHNSDVFGKAQEGERKNLELNLKKVIAKETDQTKLSIAKLKAESDKYKADMAFKISKENKGKYDRPKPKK